jgi:hypothetical protein
VKQETLLYVYILPASVQDDEQYPQQGDFGKFFQFKVKIIQDLACVCVQK